MTQRPSPTAATKQIASYVGVDDLKRLELAIKIAALEEIQRNSGFLARVLTAYNAIPAALATGSPVGGRRTGSAEDLMLDLVPIRHVEGFTFNPALPLDPFLFHEAYGTEQLRRMLGKLPLPALKEAVTLVEQRKPDTKPANRRTKAALVEYIECQVLVHV